MSLIYLLGSSLWAHLSFAGMENIGDPIPHIMNPDGGVVDLAMMEAAFLAGEDFERLLLGADGFVKLLRDLDRDLLVARAMQQQERAGHLLHDAVELEVFQFFERRGAVVDAEHPLQML